MPGEYLTYYDPQQQNGSDFNYVDQYAQGAAQQAGGSGSVNTVTNPETPQAAGVNVALPTADWKTALDASNAANGPLGNGKGPTTDPKAPDYIRQKIAEWRAKGFGRDDGAPMTDADAQYWFDRVTENGGWSDYWDTRMQERKGGSMTGGGNDYKPAVQTYTPATNPTATTPMVTSNGGIPPGVPYNPVAPTLQKYDTTQQAKGIPYNPVAAGEYYRPDLSRPSFSAQAPTYAPATISQFATPDYSQVEGLQDNVLQSILTNPALSPDYVNRQNEAQKETALAREQAAQRAAMTQAAGRGVAYGGAADARQRRIGADTTQAIMTGQRDIANTAEIANREGFLKALGASDSTLGGRANRATSFYDTLLGGQRAQADEGYRGYTSQANAFDENLRRDLGLEGLSQAESSSKLGYANMDENRQQFYRDLAARESQFERGQSLSAATSDAENAQRGSQFDRTFAQTGNIADLDRLLRSQQFGATFAQNENQFGAGYNQRERQFGDDMAYKYALANSTAYQNFINSILGK